MSLSCGLGAGGDAEFVRNITKGTHPHAQSDFHVISIK